MFVFAVGDAPLPPLLAPCAGGGPLYPITQHLPTHAAQEDDGVGGGRGPPRGGASNGSFTTLKGQGIIRHHPISVLLAVMDNTIGRDIDPQARLGVCEVAMMLRSSVLPMGFTYMKRFMSCWAEPPRCV